MKRRIAAWLVAALGLGLWLAAAEKRPGSLVIVGGGLAAAAPRVYDKFIALGGGTATVRIAIIPAASSEPVGSGREMAQDFAKAGVAPERIKVFPVSVIDDPSTPDCDESTWAKNGNDAGLAGEMLEYSAVWFVGGDQIRHAQALRKSDGSDTPLLAAIRRVLADGGVVGGSSAGAAIMSDPMICNGDSLTAVLDGAGMQKTGCDESRGVALSGGLGFFRHGLADQHFLKRGRIGRLVTALQFLGATHLGMGVDEDTAAIVRGNRMQVVGNSGVLLVDAGRATLAWTPAGLRAENISLTFLAEGDGYDFATRSVTPAPNRKPIEKGREEYARTPTVTNTFGRDVVKDLLTSGLADSKQEHVDALAFRLEGVGAAPGSRWSFRKTEETRAYWGRSASDDGAYTVVNVRLDIAPVTVTVAPLPLAADR